MDKPAGTSGIKNAFRLMISALLGVAIIFGLAETYYNAKSVEMDLNYANRLTEFNNFHEKMVVSSPKNTVDNISRILYRARHKLDLPSEKIPEFATMIVDTANKYGFDPLIIMAVIKTESDFIQFAMSPVGAMGLMQLQPETAIEVGQKLRIDWDGSHTIFGHESNVELGTYYLKQLENKFGDLELALEAYNKGPNKLEKDLANGRKLKKTYTRKVMKQYNKYKKQQATLR